MKYIDVSEWQGKIKWEKVYGQVDGVILRAGYGKNNIDKTFLQNVYDCNRLGIPCGAYWFSYAKSTDDAIKEAEYLIKVVRPYRMELPLCFDFEYDSVNSAEKAGVKMTKELASDFVRAFCNTIEQAGYWALNYANPDFLSKYFDDMIPLRYGLWLAQWPAKVDLTAPPRKCAIWQWGNSAINGIGMVDTNEAYTDFQKVIKENGLNNLNHTQTSQIDKKQEAMKWLKNVGIEADDSMRDFAWLLYEYHKRFGPEDMKNDSWVTTKE